MEGAGRGDRHDFLSPRLVPSPLVQLSNERGHGGDPVSPGGKRFAGERMHSVGGPLAHPDLSRWSEGCASRERGAAPCLAPARVCVAARGAPLATGLGSEPSGGGEEE